MWSLISHLCKLHSLKTNSLFSSLILRHLPGMLWSYNPVCRFLSVCLRLQTTYWISIQVNFFIAFCATKAYFVKIKTPHATNIFMHWKLPADTTSCCNAFTGSIIPHMMVASLQKATVCLIATRKKKQNRNLMYEIDNWMNLSNTTKHNHIQRRP